jgi:tetratricopeptide (TPR) repeat protein
VLQRLTTPDWAQEMVASVAASAGVESLTVFAWMAVGVVAVEAFLAIGLQIPKLRWPVLILGLALHAGIELLDYKIGNFSYLMMGAYLLVLPPNLGRWLGRWPDEPLVKLGGWVAPAAGAVVGLAVLALPFAEHSWVLAAVVAGVVTAVTWTERRGSTLAGAVMAAALLTGFHAATDQVRDYYRYMGGDGRARSDHARALAGYEQVVRIDPDYFSSRVRLGDLYMRQGRFEDALEQFEQAQRIDPDNSTVIERLERAEQALKRSP